MCPRNASHAHLALLRPPPSLLVSPQIILAFTFYRAASRAVADAHASLASHAPDSPDTVDLKLETDSATEETLAHWLATSLQSPPHPLEAALVLDALTHLLTSTTPDPHLGLRLADALLPALFELLPRLTAHDPATATTVMDRCCATAEALAHLEHINHVDDDPSSDGTGTGPGHGHGAGLLRKSRIVLLDLLLKTQALARASTMVDTMRASPSHTDDDLALAILAFQVRLGQLSLDRAEQELTRLLKCPRCTPAHATLALQSLLSATEHHHEHPGRGRGHPHEAGTGTGAGTSLPASDPSPERNPPRGITHQSGSGSGSGSGFGGWITPAIVTRVCSAIMARFPDDVSLVGDLIHALLMCHPDPAREDLALEILEDPHVIRVLDRPALDLTDRNQQIPSPSPSQDQGVSSPGEQARLRIHRAAWTRGRHHAHAHHWSASRRLLAVARLYAPDATSHAQSTCALAVACLRAGREIDARTYLDHLLAHEPTTIMRTQSIQAAPTRAPTDSDAYATALFLRCGLSLSEEPCDEEALVRRLTTLAQLPHVPADYLESLLSEAAARKRTRVTLALAQLRIKMLLVAVPVRTPIPPEDHAARAAPTSTTTPTAAPFPLLLADRLTDLDAAAATHFAAGSPAHIETMARACKDVHAALFGAKTETKKKTGLGPRPVREPGPASSIPPLHPQLSPGDLLPLAVVALRIGRGAFPPHSHHRATMKQGVVLLARVPDLLLPKAESGSTTSASNARPGPSHGPVPTREVLKTARSALLLAGAGALALYAEGRVSTGDSRGWEGWGCPGPGPGLANSVVSEPRRHVHSPLPRIRAAIPATSTASQHLAIAARFVERASKLDMGTTGAGHPRGVDHVYAHAHDHAHAHAQAIPRGLDIDLEVEMDDARLRLLQAHIALLQGQPDHVLRPRVEAAEDHPCSSRAALLALGRSLRGGEGGPPRMEMTLGVFRAATIRALYGDGGGYSDSAGGRTGVMGITITGVSSSSGGVRPPSLPVGLLGARVREITFSPRSTPGPGAPPGPSRERETDELLHACLLDWATTSLVMPLSALLQVLEATRVALYGGNIHVHIHDHDDHDRPNPNSATPRRVPSTVSPTPIVLPVVPPHASLDVDDLIVLAFNHACSLAEGAEDLPGAWDLFRATQAVHDADVGRGATKRTEPTSLRAVSRGARLREAQTALLSRMGSVGVGRGAGGGGQLLGGEEDVPRDRREGIGEGEGKEVEGDSHVEHVAVRTRVGLGCRLGASPGQSLHRTQVAEKRRREDEIVPDSYGSGGAEVELAVAVEVAVAVDEGGSGKDTGDVAKGVLELEVDDTPDNVG